MTRLVVIVGVSGALLMFAVFAFGTGAIAGAETPTDATLCGASAPTGGDYTPTTWAAALLAMMGIDQTPANMQGIVGWEKAEGGHWANQAKYNPLNTTQKMPGASYGLAQGNIGIYTSWAQGLEATKKTLNNGMYGVIIAALKHGPIQDIATAISKTPWNPGGYNNLLAAMQASPGGLQNVDGGVTPVMCDTGGTAVTGFANPFPHGWVPNRLDMGYDGTFTGTIVAPFPGIITFAANSWSNWGGYLELRADGPIPGLPSRTLFFAEGLGVTTSAGQRVDAGQVIAVADTMGAQAGVAGNIEFGMAQDGPVGRPSDTLSKVVADPRGMVLSFSQWVQQNLGLAPPSSTDHAGAA